MSGRAGTQPREFPASWFLNSLFFQTRWRAFASKTREDQREQIGMAVDGWKLRELADDVFRSVNEDAMISLPQH